MYCYNCQAEIVTSGRIQRSEYCRHCYADLHCCLNCEHYVADACREPQAEPVKDRAKANFCDYFTPRVTSSKSTDSSSEKAREAFRKLFK